MERLTEKGFKWTRDSIFRDIDRWSLAECLNKLSAYEDTGLTPPEVQELKERDTAKAPIPSKTGLICPICGERAAFVDKFCGSCGQRFEED